MKKILALVLCIALMASIAVGCAKEPATPEANNAEAMVVNAEKKEVTMLTEVNGKYFTETTRHGVVFKGGSNGEKSILRGLADEKEFYEALASFDITPGNNLTKDDKGKKIDGTKMNVFVTWEGLGKEIPFNDIVVSSDPRPMDIRFGGNIERANANNTGCILCLDSCPTGITSNSSYAFGESDTVKFTGNKDVLPADGTQVKVIFRVAE
jgi:hypothetical protein